MSHDGSPGPYQNAPSAVACRWGDFNLMGQPTYVKARTRWSTCSVNQLQYWAWYSGKATCVRYPPSSNPYPLSSTKLRVYDVQRQCQVRHGSQATFPSFCQKLDKVNDEMCYKLMCYDSATGQCKYGFGAAPGTPCDPTGQYICYQGACQNKANIPGISNTGNSGSSNTGNSGNSGNQGNSGSSSSNGNQCVDTPGMTFGSGNNCAQYLSNSANSYACDWQIIRQHCCQSRRTYCGSNNNPQGCVDNPTVNIGGLNCGWYLYRHASQSTCNWDYVKQQCCAARLTYCSSHIIG
ncbi:hypothetical protein EB796_003125 [Bugula neritina]|uniref:ADAMTS cysteine-rich domain-containing protein n=1 Tax=Bugula neritina TaxID=10212 RepID=A0A7J7KJX8_BUGNE|nr:hypothetical protein EB796_003125 [Bugula neritina]